MKPYRTGPGIVKLILLCVVTAFFTNCVLADEEMPSYPEVGVVLGGILQPSIGYWWGRKGIRVSGMYLDKDKKEFHLNFGYILSDSKKTQRSINLLTSRVVGSDPGADYNYGATGIAYSQNYKGFFFALGLGWPWKDDIGNLSDDPVIPVGYLGYIHRFRPD